MNENEHQLHVPPATTFQSFSSPHQQHTYLEACPLFLTSMPEWAKRLHHDVSRSVDNDTSVKEDWQWLSVGRTKKRHRMMTNFNNIIASKPDTPASLKFGLQRDSSQISYARPQKYLAKQQQSSDESSRQICRDTLSVLCISH